MLLGAAVIGPFALLRAVYLDYQEAREAGFWDAAERNMARQAGITDAKAFYADGVRDRIIRERRAAEEAEAAKAKAAQETREAADPIVGSSSLVVRHENYGDRWPFPKFQRGIITCETYRGRPSVFITLGRQNYSLNGVALEAGKPDSALVMARGQYGYPETGALDQLIKQGTGLCK